jgi:integrase
MLPYRWQHSEKVSALRRIQLIYQQVQAGQTLQGAAAIVNGSSSRTEENWHVAIERFEHHKKSFGNAISEHTWRTKYFTPLQSALSALGAHQPPTNAADLLDIVLSKWKPGSRSRQIAAQNLSQFLNYVTERLQFKSCWVPPPKLANHVGMKKRGEMKRDGYPLTDTQILRLIDGLPNTQSGFAWRFAVQLMAAYGLRPEELRYLVVKPSPDGRQLWCGYQKKSGGGLTKSRQLHLLAVRDLDGTAQDWNLISRLQLHDALPSLGKPGKAGEALNTYMRRQPIWSQLKAEALAIGEVLVPYSLRHRYSAEAHRLGIPSKDIAQAMGHSLECHLRAYARFTSNETANAFAAATTRLETALALPVHG